MWRAPLWMGWVGIGCDAMYCHETQCDHGFPVNCSQKRYRQRYSASALDALTIGTLLRSDYL